MIHSPWGTDSKIALVGMGIVLATIFAYLLTHS